MPAYINATNTIPLCSRPFKHLQGLGWQTKRASIIVAEIRDCDNMNFGSSA